MIIAKTQLRLICDHARLNDLRIFDEA